MRDRFPLLLLGLVALGLVLGGALVQGGRRGAFAERGSSYRSEPDGTRALFLVLEEQGLAPVRWQRPLEELPPGAPLALLQVDASAADAGFSLGALAGSEGLEREEVTRLLDHVAGGGALLLAPHGTAEDALLDALKVRLIPLDGEDLTEVRTLVPAQPTLYTRGVEAVEAPLPAGLWLPRGAVPLLVDEEREVVAAAVVPWGRGRVVVLAAPELLSNRYLGRAGNARLATVLARTLGGGQPLHFDELHHGFRSGRSLGAFARRYGLDAAAAQLALGLMVWALSLRRLGAVRAAARDLRVGATDALMALSRIYREGRHHAHAAASLVQGLSADLAPRAGVTPGSAPDEVAAALEARGHPALARALREAAARAPGVRTDGDLLSLARSTALARRLQHQPTP